MRNVLIVTPLLLSLVGQVALASSFSSPKKRQGVEQKSAIPGEAGKSLESLIIRREKTNTGLVISEVDLESLLKRGPDVTGGGNDIGLDFQAAALRALQNLNSGLLDETTREEVFEKIKTAKFIKANGPLSTIDGNHREQDAIAVNIPGQNSVYIDEKWRGLAREEIRQTMALHEVLSLLKIENTGDYHISSQLKNAMTEPINLGKAVQVAPMTREHIQNYQAELFAEMKKGAKDRTPFKILKELFDTAPAAATENDFLPEKEFPRNIKNAFRTFVWEVEPNTSLSSVLGSGRYESNLQVLVLGHLNRVIRPYSEAQPATPSAGPLFPSEAGKSEVSALCEEIRLIQTIPRWQQPVIPAGDSKYCEVGSFTELSPYHKIEKLDVQFYQSASEFIQAAEFQYEDGIVANETSYFRRSGAMLAIKRVRQEFKNGLVTTSTTYGYAWKE